MEQLQRQVQQLQFQQQQQILQQQQQQQQIPQEQQQQQQINLNEQLRVLIRDAFVDMNVRLPVNLLNDLTSEHLREELRARFSNANLGNIRVEEYAFDPVIIEQDQQQQNPREQALQRLLAVIRSSADVNCRVMIRNGDQWEIINGNVIQNYTDEQMRTYAEHLYEHNHALAEGELEHMGRVLLLGPLNLDTVEDSPEKIEMIKSALFLGMMTPEQAVLECQRIFRNLTREQQANLFVPARAEYLGDPPIAVNMRTGRRFGDFNYRWPQNDGYGELTFGGRNNPELDINEYPMVAGEEFDRLGSENGTFVAPIGFDGPQALWTRALPYYFEGDDVTRQPQYHRYRVLRDLTPENLRQSIDDTILAYQTSAPEEADAVRNRFERELFRSNGLTTFGVIAPAFEPGVTYGSQIHLPMSVENLIALGFVEEITDMQRRA